MRASYFTGFLHDLVRASGELSIVDVQTFAQVGYTEKPLGLRLEYADGSRMFLQVVGSAPDGGAAIHPDKPREYEPAGGAAVASATGTRPAPNLSRADLERFVKDLIEKSGRSDIVEVQVSSENSSSQPYGVNVKFEDGAGAFVLFLGAARKGGERPEAPLYGTS